MQELAELTEQVLENPEQVMKGVQRGASAVVGAATGYVEGKKGERLKDSYLTGTAIGAIQPVGQEVADHVTDYENGIATDVGFDMLTYEGARAWGFEYAKED